VPRLRSNHVFLNCPFDASYRTILDAIVFSIYDLEFVARCALEVDDSSEYRLEKISRIIEQCRFGIHDISAVTLDAVTGLPRFNMPLELGLYLGCKRFGAETQQKKACLILDTHPYRYRDFISDIAGLDIHSHNGDPERAVREVRNWLAGVSHRKGLPGGDEVVARYNSFLKDVPRICAQLKRDPDSLTFTDIAETIEIWLETTL
jgi:hypothetical protein